MIATSIDVDPWTDIASHVAAWMATYLIHSVALFVLAIVCARLWHSPRVREQFWRAALFGPLVTASLQLGAGLDPIGGTWSVERAADAQSTLLLREESIPSEIAYATLPNIRSEPRTLPAATSGSVLTALNPMALAACILLALGIGLLTLRAVLEAVRMQRLGDRRRILSGPLVEMVEHLACDAGLGRRIRVEVSAEPLLSPYATGAFLPRIVVPERALDGLSTDAQSAMIAHEIGHIARFDPLWTAAARTVATLFFFQPCNWIAAKKLAENAEFACDEFAIGLTGDEVALAQCLTRVAEWIVGPAEDRARAVPACPMAHHRSKLKERVERILATEGRERRTTRLPALTGSVAVLLTAFAAPGVAIAAGPAGAPEFIAYRTGLDVRRIPTAELFASLEQMTQVVEAEIGEVRALGRRNGLPVYMARRLDAMTDRVTHLRSLIRSLQHAIAAR